MYVGEHSPAKLSSQSSGFYFPPLIAFANLYQFNTLLSSKYTAGHGERESSACLHKFIEHKLFIKKCNTLSEPKETLKWIPLFRYLLLSCELSQSPVASNNRGFTMGCDPAGGLGCSSSVCHKLLHLQLLGPGVLWASWAYLSMFFHLHRTAPGSGKMRWELWISEFSDL